MAQRDFDVVHLGSAARDLTEEDPRGWRLGGGASYAALTTARLGLSTAAVVGVDDLAAEAAELDLLREAGVVVELARLGEGPIFRNLELPTGRIQLCPARGEPIPVSSVPSAWANARAWSMVPVAGELDDTWTRVVPEDAFLALGWQGWLRVLVSGQQVRRRDPEASELLARADLIGVSRHDLGPERSPESLLGYLHPGAALAVTDGLEGGRLLTARAGDPGPSHDYAAVRPARTVDPTGAGDVFLAALTAVTIRPDILGRESQERWDLEFAATVASFVVEDAGMMGVPTLAAVQERLARA